jgi:aldehyde:ferredoxin oxidoreductase
MANGHHGRVLHVNLTDQTSSVEEIEESVYRKFLGGYGLGAYLMWKHFPEGTEPLAPEARFAICSGLLTGTKTPFSGRIQIVGKSPLTGTWADSNSGGTVAVHLREAGFDALMVTGKAAEPTVLVVEDGEVRFDSAGDLWGQQVPEAFDTLVEKYGSKRHVGVSAIGPAGERSARIASVMNDRYHAFGRQGFGAIYGSKNLKAIVVGGSGKVPIANESEFTALTKSINARYKKKVGFFKRIMTWLAQPKKWMGWLYRMTARKRIKLKADGEVMKNVMAKRGTTSAVALSVENGDAPIRNWAGVGSKEFPIRSKSMKIDGAAVDKIVTKRLSCGDCPMPCKGIVKIKDRGLKDVRRPDYETLIGFGANLLNDDLATVTACHDACNRYGMDALSSSATLGWVCEAYEKGLLTTEDLDGIEMTWGDGEAALQLTEKMGSGEGCGEWLSNGVAFASKHVGNGTEAFAVHVHGCEPAYHDPRFTSLMGVNYISDPTPGRHTTGSATWNETFDAGFALPNAVPKKEVNVEWKGTEGKGVAQAHYSNAHQVLNGLGLCMFTGLFMPLPWVDLVNALTDWDVDEVELLACGERIQNMRAAFNRREGISPADFKPHPRMMGEGEDGKLTEGPLAGISVPLIELRTDYYAAMHWDTDSGHLSRARADELGLTELLDGYLS